MKIIKETKTLRPDARKGSASVEWVLDITDMEKITANWNGQLVTYTPDRLVIWTGWTVEGFEALSVFAYERNTAHAPSPGYLYRVLRDQNLYVTEDKDGWPSPVNTTSEITEAVASVVATYAPGWDLSKNIV